MSKLPRGSGRAPRVGCQPVIPKSGYLHNDTGRNIGDGVGLSETATATYHRVLRLGLKLQRGFARGTATLPAASFNPESHLGSRSVNRSATGGRPRESESLPSAPPGFYNLIWRPPVNSVLSANSLLLLNFRVIVPRCKDSAAGRRFSLFNSLAKSPLEFIARPANSMHFSVIIPRCKDPARRVPFSLNLPCN